MNLDENTIDRFATDVDYYTEINKQIKVVKNTIKPLRENLKKLVIEKKEIELQLCNTLKKNDLDEIELPGNKGLLEFKITNSVIPIKQDDIKVKLIDFFESGKGSEISFNSLSSEKKGLEVYNYIYLKENRDKIKKESLKLKT
jgi:hypothetical protein